MEEEITIEDQLQLLQQSLYKDNINAVIKTLTLAFGEVSKTIDHDDQQVMITRSRADGTYFIHMGGLSFPVHEARLILTIPEEGRKLIESLEKNKGTIEINKYALEDFTRIDGKAMPNDKIVL